MDFKCVLLVLVAVCLISVTAVDELKGSVEQEEDESISDLESADTGWHHYLKKFAHAGIPVSYAFPAYSYYRPYGPYGVIYGGYGYGGYGGLGYPGIYGYPYGYGYFR